LTSGAGGEVYYDRIPQVRYRMHRENVIGTNTGLQNRMRRLYMLSRGRFQRWSEMNVAALEPFRPCMTPALFDAVGRSTSCSRRLFGDSKAESYCFKNQLAGRLVNLHHGPRPQVSQPRTAGRLRHRSF
jgi:hypothetical protein